MSTCNRLDLQTLGSQPPVMPRNLPDHCAGGTASEIPPEHDGHARKKARSKITQIPSYGLTLIPVQNSVVHPVGGVWLWWAINYPTTWGVSRRTIHGWRFLSAHKFALFSQLHWFVLTGYCVEYTHTLLERKEKMRRKNARILILGWMWAVGL